MWVIFLVSAILSATTSDRRTERFTVGLRNGCALDVCYVGIIQPADVTRYYVKTICL